MDSLLSLVIQATYHFSVAVRKEGTIGSTHRSYMNASLHRGLTLFPNLVFQLLTSEQHTALLGNLSLVRLCIFTTSSVVTIIHSAKLLMYMM